MDDFLGTSIQYSEQQILRLEREHAEQMERTASELIQNGFLDTDYEDSDTESTLTDFSSDSRSVEVLETVDDDIAPDSPNASIADEVDTDEIETEIETETDPALEFTDSISASVPDNASAVESEADLDLDLNIDADDERESEVDRKRLELRLSLLLHRMSLSRLMETIVSDIRGLAMMVLLLVALQMANERADERFDEDETFEQAPCPRLHRHTQIQYYWHEEAPFLKNSNDAEDEDEKGEEEVECATRRTLNFDVVTTTFDAHTNTVYRSKSFGHAIRVNDLFSDEPCDVARYANSNGPYGASPVVRVPRQIPRLLLQVGAGLKSPQVMRIFKETVADTGRRMVRNHGLTALVISFAGIAAVTAANSGLDDLL